MPNFVHILLRVLAGIAGALLLYVAFFLYEDEEARLQNRLEEIWHKISALQSQAMSKEVAFLQGAVEAISKALDHLFGYKLLSVQAIAVSMNFSLASFFAVTAAFGAGRWTHTRDRVIIACAALGLVVLASSASLSFKKSHEYFVPLFGSLGVAIVSAPTLYRFRYRTGTNPRQYAVALIVLLLIGVTVDILFIAFYRRVLRVVQRTSHSGTVLGMLAGLTGVALLLAAPGVFISIPALGHWLVHSTASWLSVRGFAQIACFESETNIVAVVCLLFLILLLALLLVHRVAWPLIKRPIYAANRKQLIKNSKLLGALGTMLLLYAFPNNPIVKWVTHFLPNLKGG